MNNAFTSGWTGGQYSFCRWMTGAFFSGWFGALGIQALSSSPPSGTVYGVPTLPQQFFPTLTSPAGFAIVGLAGCLSGLWLIAGHRKWIPAAALAVLSLLFLDARSTFWPLGASMAVIHALAPATAWGSCCTRKGRVGHDWQLPAKLFAVGWIVLGAFLVSVVYRTLQLATASEISAPATTAFVALALWPLCWFRRIRPWLWLLYVAFGILLALRGAPWLIWGPYALTMLMSADPGWIPALRGKAGERLYYDGDCGLCHGAVEFVLSEDRNDPPFSFAPLDSRSFRDSVPAERRAQLPDSTVVCDDEGTLRTRSDGVLYLGRRMGGIWRLGADLIRWVPRPLRDAVYDGIARIRHRLFRKPETVCPLVPEELRPRFLS